MHSGMPPSSFTLVSAHQQIQFIMQAKLDHLQRTALLSDMARVGAPNSAQQSPPIGAQCCTCGGRSEEHASTGYR